ncbi:MAG: AraC family transcriptional regulator [Clostridia bacterium]|nr:AraC family transcriptional regulator [Clostridia bacterium]
MRRTYINRIQSNIDFNVVQYGREDCRKNYTVANFVRKNYLIHYVLRGKGMFMMQGKTYFLHTGQAFLIPPDITTVYSSDVEEPWEYAWVEFCGGKTQLFLEMSKLGAKTPIFNDEPPYKARDAILELTESGELPVFELTARLWRFLGLMCVASAADSRSITQKAKEYMQTNLMRHPTVEDVAKYVGVDRSYLSRLFAAKEGIAPKRYMVRLKMHYAAALLRETKMSVGAVARETGFENQMNFSNAFKNFYGMSPSQWRKNIGI